MKKIVYEFIFVLIFSIIGFFILIGFHDLLVMLGIKHDWSGTERVGLWGFLLGLPIGSASGVLVIDYFYFRTDGWKIFGLICALILGTFGCLIGIVLHDYFKLGQLYWIVTPLLNTLFSIIGYKFGMLLR